MPRKAYPARFLLVCLLGFTLWHFWGRRELLPATSAASRRATPFRNLVMVAGHAVFIGVEYSKSTDPQQWALASYHKGVEGVAESFLTHIQRGVEQAAADPSAMLLFSGGQTKFEAGPRSEGVSYWLIAEANRWFSNTTSDPAKYLQVRSRAFTEEHARDSYENLLFSLCRFYEITGRYPENITVISYGLKQQRFQDLHRAAVLFPASRFKFIGTPLPSEKGAAQAEAGEAKTRDQFIKDPYGCGPELLPKKGERDPFFVGPPHATRCPELGPLIAYCGSSLYSGTVPWT